MGELASASQELANRISRDLAHARHAPGSVICPEQELRDRHGAGHVLFRQAVRILEHRGVLRLRRGARGGVVFVGQEDIAVARNLARLIESQAEDVFDIWSVQQAIDELHFRYEVPHITLEESRTLRALIASLEAMPQEDFARAMGHRTINVALHKLMRDDLLLLAQRVVFEAGADLFPSRWQVAAESVRREFWAVILAMAESLIANDAAAFFRARQAQGELLKAAFDAARRQAPGRAQGFLFRQGAVNWEVPEQPDAGTFSSRADFLVREILDDIRVRGWRQGERLGTTADLVAHYRVSLPVLRQALRVLEESGAVRVSRGRSGGLEIGAPAQSASFRRTVEFIRTSNASTEMIEQFVVRLLLKAIEEAPMRCDAHDMGALRTATQHAGPRFDLGDASVRTLCIAIAAASKNKALQVFIDALIAATDAHERQPPERPRGGPMLDALWTAMSIGDAGLARRALLSYVEAHQGVT